MSLKICGFVELISENLYELDGFQGILIHQLNFRYGY